ncbi:MAG TPA: EamA family transporter [Candidatus Limnocylindrales bacterium]|nr:EamA family transporter [Candidatus Limnocylindrales bacterium]
MPTTAIALVLIAAVLHAGWNVLLKTSGDTLSTAVRLQAIGTAVLVPIGIVAWLNIGSPAVPAAAIGLAVVSGFLEAAYFVLLASAYRRGPLSLVYPLARGSAPLIAVVVGIVLLQERLAPLAFVGVGCLLVGILLVSRPWRAFRAAGAEHRGAIGFALATGASIAAYSAVDRLGVRETEPWVYGSILAVVASVLTATAVFGGRRLGLLAPAPDRRAGAGGDTGARFAGLARDAVAGVLSLGAYLLVLLAYSFAPLATVAPLREAGIVLAAAWGAVRLKESSGGRDAATKIAAAGLVVLGAILLAVAR